MYHFESSTNHLGRKAPLAAACQKSFLGLLGIALGSSSLLQAETSPSSPDSGTTIEISSLKELRNYASQDDVQVRLKPGTYTLDEADSNHFIQFTGEGGHFDLNGVTLRVDTRLFREFGRPKGDAPFYSVIDLRGDDIVFEGATIETFSDAYGVQSRNKIVNLTGSNVTLKNVDITTSGSLPWGYGSLYGIGGSSVRKMNGIRVGWPATNSKLIGCRVHMRAMGHAIFVQGAEGTLIEDCHVDGLLRKTNDILAEKSGYAFERDFKVPGKNYVEGTSIGPDGSILPDEIISLSEDGIRLYRSFNGKPTGSTTIRNCSVTRMRRGICIGLNRASDVAENCVVTECITAGFNVSTGDRVENCSSDAKYAEALSCPYNNSRNARVDLKILDSRKRIGNNLLATINGRGHQIHLHTEKPEFVPASLEIVYGTNRGYAFYEGRARPPRNIQLTNDTPATVVHEAKGKPD